MKVLFKIGSGLLRCIRQDLYRKHPYAHERVGFITAKAAALAGGGLCVTAYGYETVADDHYMDRPEVGAFVGAAGLRAALQHAYRAKCSMFHVHLHEHRGRPWFGEYDLSENAKFVPDFFNVAPATPHGAVILSHDAAAGLCWRAGSQEPQVISEVVEGGAPLRIFRGIKV
ncbi:hypothetical protein [Phenylobacterium sp.]|jgi:hypothetical protein|uniref:hypothetical protein n=1 Tax=Phenylobacterium sp. TaxID=1871053 RepID=UPI0025FF09FA|nr:hypothetical protein [Phenylobacterium sp.]